MESASVTRIRRKRSASEVAEWLAACKTIARECDRVLLGCLTGHDVYDVSLDRIEALASTSLASLSGSWARRDVIRTMAAFRFTVADAARRPTEKVLARLAEARSVVRACGSGSTKTRRGCVRRRFWPSKANDSCC
jgi:hypothetical protein